MGTEIEVKLRVADHEPVRTKLRQMGATCEGMTEETNTFFDTPSAELRKADKGLRIRRNKRPDGEELVVTYKGPKQAGAFKNREEIEVVVDDHDTLVSLFERLGYGVTLSFEKRRETWRLGDAEIVLDELPPQVTGGGKFLEIEAADEATVRAVLGKLGLEKEAGVKESYIQLIAAWAEREGGGVRVVRF